MTELVYPSPFYRVSAKALIFDDQKRLLMLQNEDGMWEIPGGGWEHGESFEEVIRREVYEEQGVEVAHIGPVSLVFQSEQVSKQGYIALRIAARVELRTQNFTFGDGIVGGEFVTPQQLEHLAIAIPDEPIKRYVDQIWAGI